MATIGLKQYDDSLHILMQGLALDPTNKAMHTLKKEATILISQQETTLAEGMKKFFL